MSLWRMPVVCFRSAARASVRAGTLVMAIAIRPGEPSRDQGTATLRRMRTMRDNAMLKHKARTHGVDTRTARLN